MPEVPQPESLAPELQLIREMAERIPEPLRSVLTQDRPIDFRPVNPVDPFRPVPPLAPVRHVWFRALGPLPADTMVHQAVLAYASDYGLISTALQPHGLTFRSRGLQMASLDHSLWMHKRFRVDEWLLYAMDSPVAAGARGFARGQIFTRAGELVASVAQEGLMRVRPPTPTP
jgi:acyl-CoA thioesterase-2